MMNYRLCVVVLVAAVGYTQADWETDPKWAFQTYIGGDIELHCNDTFSMVMDGDKVKWFSPKNVEIMTSEKYLLSELGGTPDAVLKVKEVMDDDSGVYVCMIHRSGTTHQVLRGINVYEPMYKDIIDKYRYNIMVGGIAAAALFVPLVTMCFIYKYRFKTAAQRDQSRIDHRMRQRHTELEAGPLPSKSAPQNGAGNVNPGYDDENTKM